MNIKPLLVILSALLLSNCSEQQNTLKIPPLPDGAYLLKEVARESPHGITVL